MPILLLFYQFIDIVCPLLKSPSVYGILGNEENFLEFCTKTTIYDRVGVELYGLTFLVFYVPLIHCL